MKRLSQAKVSVAFLLNTYGVKQSPANVSQISSIPLVPSGSDRLHALFTGKNFHNSMHRMSSA